MGGKRSNRKFRRNAPNHASDPKAGPHLHQMLMQVARNRRNAPTGDKLTDVTIELATLVRIGNGQYLQSLLVSGEVDVDQLVQELLHMGPVTLQELIAIEPTAAKTLMDKIKELATTLTKDAETKSSEDGVLLLEKIRQAAAEFGNVQQLKGENEYKTNLNNLKVSNFGGQLISNFYSRTESLINYLQSIANKDVNELKAADFQWADDALRDVADIETYSAQFGPVQTELKALKATSYSLTFLKPVENYINQETVLRNQNTNTVDKNKLMDNSQTLNDVAGTFKNAEGWTDQMEKLVMSRQPDGNHTGMYTAGLPNGSKDLVMLEVDVGDEKLRKLINGTVETSQNMIDALTPMKDFGTETNSLDSTWQKTAELGAVGKMQKAKEKIEWMGTAHDISAIVDKLTQCNGTFPTSPATRTSIDVLKREGKELENQLTAMPSFDYVSQLNFDALKENLTLKSTTPDAKLTELKTKLAAMKSSGALQTTVAEVTQLKNDLGVLKNFLSVKNGNITNIVAELPNVGKLQQELANDPFSSLMVCLNNTVSDADGKKLMREIESIRELRDAPLSAELNDAFAMMETVLSSRGVIKAVRSKGTGMKGKTNKKMKAMKVLASDMVKTFGTSVRGLVIIRKALALKAQVDPFLTMDISRMIQEATTLNLPQDNIDALNALLALQTSLKTMYTEIDGFLSSIQNFNAVDVASYGLVFEEAAKIKSVMVPNQQELMAALVALQNALPPNSRRKRSIDSDISTAGTSLDKLTQLDLNFAQYNFVAAKPALAAFQQSLVEFHAAMIAGFGNTDPSSQPGAVGSTEASVSLLVWIPIGIVVFVVAIGVCIYCLRRYFKKDNNKRTSKTEKTKSDEKAPLVGENKEKTSVANKTVNKKPKITAEPKKTEKKSDKDDKKKKPEKTTKDNSTEKASAPKAVSDEKVTNDPVAGDAAVPPVVPSGDELEKSTAPDLNPAQPYHWQTLAKATCESFGKEKVSDWCDKMLKTIGRAQWSHKVTENPEQMRYGISHADHLVVLNGFSNTFINANSMEISDRKWIMAQAPQDGTEEPDGSKIDTRGKHWGMIDQENVGICIQLCNFQEPDQNNVIKTKCSHYYPEAIEAVEKYSPYTVKAIQNDETVLSAFSEEDRRTMSIVRLEYTRDGCETSKRVDILRFFGWPDHAAPSSPDVVLKMLDLIKTHYPNDTVLVHCSAGVGRTGSLVAVEKGIEMVDNQSLSGFEQLIMDMRGHRAQAIQAKQQVIFVVMAITKYYMDKHRVNENKYYSELGAHLRTMQEQARGH